MRFFIGRKTADGKSVYLGALITPQQTRINAWTEKANALIFDTRGQAESYIRTEEVEDAQVVSEATLNIKYTINPLK
jgi:hypothetical protein